MLEASLDTLSGSAAATFSPSAAACTSTGTTSSAPALAPGSSGVFLFDDPSAARAGPMPEVVRAAFAPEFCSLCRARRERLQKLVTK